MSTESNRISPYRKVSVSMWSDSKVKRLSPIAPSGRALFLMLLVGEQTTHIPGVQPIGRLAFAEQLEWEPEAFDEAFAEAFREGLVEADWKARLVFVPKAIKHNIPQSPNVVKSWASTWLRIPECDLKRRAWAVLYAALAEQSDALAEAFKAACPLDSEGAGEEPDLPSGKPSPKPSGKPSEKPSGKASSIQEAVNSKQEAVNRKESKPLKASASALPIADPPPEKKENRKPVVCFGTFIADCKAKKESLIPEDDPLFDWAEDAKLPFEFLELAWVEFKSRYLGDKRAKRYRDWRAVFRNAVRDNWFKLWYVGDDGAVLLTSQGRLIERTHKAKKAPEGGEE